MAKLSKIRDNKMIMFFKMRDKIDLRKNRLNLKKAKTQELRNSLYPILFLLGKKMNLLPIEKRQLPRAQWKEAIKSDIDSILQNYTWELIDLPHGYKPLGYKWIFKNKMKADDIIDKYIPRLVIKEFRPQKGLDYFDTYSTRITLVTMILAIVVLKNLEVHQVDVKMTFVNGDLDKVLYMNQPEDLWLLD
ncbi:calcineurin B-like protein 4 [Tanacetum coccineum]